MNSRVILVSDDRSSLRAPGSLLWPDAACMRGMHTGEWAAHIFEYAMSFEGNMTQVRDIAAANGVGVLHPHGALATEPPSLIVCDVDSTITRTEAIDLLAECAGKANEVHEITARAMAGELDFTESLHARVRCLEGLHIGALEEARKATIVTPGAAELVAAAHEVGAAVGLVSGGFTAFVNPLLDHIGADFAASNELEVVDDHLTGRVAGNVIDRAAKATWLRRWVSERGTDLERTIAVGDGANDLDMFAIAGLPIAFCAKPVAVEAARNTIRCERIDAVRAVWTH
ncbi:phosphoserine phosphatase SerB [Cutibacterium sp. WCA-380-WT-3A]|uniref:phosphoserine phosphatase n=1 Tax=Cutibacterium porci TaxID=2605781 RepID=A0A7K0J8J7_9ACTN|nr:phosphoserine phosphatase SerB [Cutibacterium porci]MSS46282.1 phosphoserine phosphatase SerB [Cutibacterium porci]